MNFFVKDFNAEAQRARGNAEFLLSNGKVW